ncbi:putative Tyrosine aminotransferase [Zostera marina]|uniref:Putative Tyrosine aminotransferase n=1 Tax=Zostera marina TaxID=29655 RepID=A0A0K9PX71_ZOSMR|nr:putative Tyrosine aminotransferase [Zostera marina]
METPAKNELQGNSKETPFDKTVRGYIEMLISNIDHSQIDAKPMIPLGHGDPSSFSSFRPSPVLEDAVMKSIRSEKFNGYAHTSGIASARRAVGDYLSRDLPHSLSLSPEDIYITCGCNHAIQILVSVLSFPGANILLPTPGYPHYEVNCDSAGIAVRHYNLLPEKGWEIDLDSVEAEADENTVAIVVINPGNPCGTVFSSHHLLQIAETADKLGILVIADEVYHGLAFGNNPFVSMGVYSPIVPILTLGSLSKKWLVPGYRLGWIAVNDPKGILKKKKFTHNIAKYMSISANPATFIQASVSEIIEKTEEEFFNKTILTLRDCAQLCYTYLQEIDCITCPHKSDGSMFAMVKLNFSRLADISDDTDFCCKLAKEESVIILPGTAVGLSDWLRITFAVDLASLQDGLIKLKNFCRSHRKISGNQTDEDSYNP